MISQLNPYVEMYTPLGLGHAMFLWESPHELWWGVVQVQTGEVWWWRNHLIRVAENISESRYATSSIKISAHLEEALAPHKERYK